MSFWDKWSDHTKYITYIINVLLNSSQISSTIFWVTSPVVYIFQYSMHGLQLAFSISLVHRINHLKCIMHRITPPSPPGWGCLDFIRISSESALTITTVLMNAVILQLIEIQRVYPHQNVLTLWNNSNGSGAKLQHPE